jgi:hypothetical protein
MSPLLKQLPAFWNTQWELRNAKSVRLATRWMSPMNFVLTLLKSLLVRLVRSTKKQVDDNDSENKCSSENTHHYYFGPTQLTSNEKVKTTHYSPEIVVEIRNKNGEVVPIRALWDTGMSGTLLLIQYIAPTMPKAFSGLFVVWKTIGGTFLTK